MIKPSVEQSCNTQPCVEIKCKTPGSVDYVYAHEAYWIEFNLIGSYYTYTSNYGRTYEATCRGGHSSGSEEYTSCYDVLTPQNHTGYYLQASFVYCTSGYNCHCGWTGTYSTRSTHKVPITLDLCNQKIPVYRTCNGYRYSPGTSHCSNYRGSYCRKLPYKTDSNKSFFYDAYIGRTVERVPI